MSTSFRILLLTWFAYHIFFCCVHQKPFRETITATILVTTITIQQPFYTTKNSRCINRGKGKNILTTWVYPIEIYVIYICI